MKLPVNSGIPGDVIRTLEQADRMNHKRDRDLEVRTRLILSSPDGSRFEIQVSDAGTLSAVSL